MEIKIFISLVVEMNLMRALKAMKIGFMKIKEVLFLRGIESPSQIHVLVD